MTKYYVKINPEGEFWRLPGPYVILHRVFGPAATSKGDLIWIRYNKRHRENGPAIIFSDGGVAYYLDGESYTKDRYDELLRNKGCSV